MEYSYEDSNPHFSLWKPPGNYFPCGEAPPPYEEAVRMAQLENDINSQMQVSNSIPVSSIVSRQTQSQETRTLQSNSCRHGTSTTSANNNINNNIGDTTPYANSIVQNVTVHSTNDNVNDNNMQMIQKSKLQNYSIHKRNANRNPDKTDRTCENVPLTNSKENYICRKDRPTSSTSKNQKLEICEKNVNGKPISKTSRHDIMLCKLENTLRSNDKQNPTESDISKKVCKMIDNSNFQLDGRSSTSKMSEAAKLPLLKSNKSTHSMLKHLYRDTAKINNTNILENARSAFTFDDLKKTPLHRTLPKNLRELLVNADIVIDKTSTQSNDNSMKRSYSSTYDHPLSSTKSYTNLTDVLMKNIKDFVSESVIPPPPENFSSANSEQNPTPDESHSIISYKYLSSSQDEDDYR